MHESAPDSGPEDDAAPKDGDCQDETGSRDDAAPTDDTNRGDDAAVSDGSDGSEDACGVHWTDHRDAAEPDTAPWNCRWHWPGAEDDPADECVADASQRGHLFSADALDASTPSVAVAMALDRVNAERSGSDGDDGTCSAQGRPLADSIDPDALDELFGRHTASPFVRFRHGDLEVAVLGDCSVAILPATRCSPDR